MTKADEDIEVSLSDTTELSETIEPIIEKTKAVQSKPPISRSVPMFNNGNQFRGSQGNNINNRQRPGRAANRGR